MLGDSLNLIKKIVLCFLMMMPITASFSAKNNGGPTNIDGYFSSGSDRRSKIGDLFETIFSELQNIQNLEINRFALLSILEAKDKVIIKAELPGLEKDEVKIDINDHNLFISGEKKEETAKNKEDNCHVCELSYGKFSRKVSLPFVIEADKTTASFEKGVLTIVIQKPETKMSKSQSIPISPKEEK